MQLATDRLTLLKKHYQYSVEHTGNVAAPSDVLQIYLAGATIVVPPESATQCRMPPAAACFARRTADYSEHVDAGRAVDANYPHDTEAEEDERSAAALRTAAESGAGSDSE